MELIAPAELIQAAVQAETRQEEHQIKVNTRHHYIACLMFQDLGRKEEGI